MSDINRILMRLEAKQAQLVGSVFALPIIRGIRPKISVDNIICTIKRIRNKPRDFGNGLAVVKALSTSEVRFLDTADLMTRADFLESLPEFRMILVKPENEEEASSWVALPLKGDSRLPAWGMMRIFMVEDGQKFDRVIARRDAAGNLWYETHDFDADLGEADWLRLQLSDPTPPLIESLTRSGLTPEIRAAYDTLRESAVAEREKNRVRTIEEKIRDSVAFRGGQYVSHVRRGNSQLAVTVMIRDERGNSHEHIFDVRDTDFMVVHSSICLNGHDGSYDLSSLVSVVREGYRRNLIHRTR